MNPLRRRRRPMAEINVVPYIDVMLVLLVIFMITAPLLNLGVEVELPESEAEPLPGDGDMDVLLVTVTAGGELRLHTEGRGELVDAQTLIERVSAFVRRNRDLEVLVGGDRNASYGQVLNAMVLLQQAGVPRVGLMSDPEQDAEAGGA